MTVADMRPFFSYPISCLDTYIAAQFDLAAPCGCHTLDVCYVILGVATALCLHPSVTASKLHACPMSYYE